VPGRGTVYRIRTKRWENEEPDHSKSQEQWGQGEGKAQLGDHRTRVIEKRETIHSQRKRSESSLPEAFSNKSDRGKKRKGGIQSGVTQTHSSAERKKETGSAKGTNSYQEGHTWTPEEETGPQKGSKSHLHESFSRNSDRRTIMEANKSKGKPPPPT